MKRKSRKTGNLKCLFGVILAIVTLTASGCSAKPTGSVTNADKSTAPASTAPVAETKPSETPAQTESIPEKTPEVPVEESVPTEYKNALKKAKSYSDTMHMSKAGIYDQLTSEYGEQFSAEAAQYAVDNVDADWKANALKKAQSYQDTMSMSPAAIRDQLTSEYGEQFTKDEAEYAISHLQ